MNCKAFNSIVIEANKKIFSKTGKRVIGNSGWLFVSKLSRLAISFLMGAWLARHLGPERFGTYSYVLSFVALSGSLTSLGLNGIVVRDIAQDPKNELETLGTSFVLKLLGGFLGILVSLVITWNMPSQEPTVRWMTTIVSLGLIFNAFRCIDLHFQAKIKSKYTVFADNISIALGIALAAFLIAQEASLIYFSLIPLTEAVVTAIALFLTYGMVEKGIHLWKFSLARSNSLLSQCWPLIISQVGVLIYFKIDQIMLERIAGNEAVGLYSSASRLSESIYFVPAIIMTSLFPVILSAKANDSKKYKSQLQNLYTLMFFLALLFIIPISLLSPKIILTLYGSAYQPAAKVLSIHIWASIFIFQGSVLSKWLISEGLLKFSFLRHGLGATLNIVLNLILIPRYGPAGAAIATVISYGSASYTACFLYKKTMPAGAMMTKAFVSPFLIFRSVKN